MRGYFAIGAERISKPMNLGSLLRSAHAFGASFFFTVDPGLDSREVGLSDTSDAAGQLPLYSYRGVDDLVLPRGCSLVGVELTEEAIELPSFRHPTAAAYVLGPERGSLTAEMMARCDHMIKISDKILCECRYRWGHRDVRPDDLSRATRTTAGQPSRPARDPAGARAWRAGVAQGQIDPQ